jgi:hypothetical protein
MIILHRYRTLSHLENLGVVESAAFISDSVGFVEFVATVRPGRVTFHPTGSPIFMGFYRFRRLSADQKPTANGDLAMKRCVFVHHAFGHRIAHRLRFPSLPATPQSF